MLNDKIFVIKRISKLAVFTLLTLTVIYFLMCSFFIYQAALINPSCPGLGNTPTKWSFPEKITAAINPEQQPRFPLLNAGDWQMPHYQTVSLPSRDPNTTIHAWYTLVDPSAPVVVITHGIHPNCKANYETLLVSAMLTQGGINVLSIDLQNHGKSSKNSLFTTYGQSEHLDLLGAYDWLLTQGFSHNQIGLAGLSLGAVTSAIAFSQEENIQAVWLDSPFSDFDSMFCFELGRRNLPCFFKHGVLMIGHYILKASPNTIPTTDAIRKQGLRHVFLTHGTSDRRIPFEHALHFQALSQQHQTNATFWFVEDNAHLEAMLQYPRMYQAKMVDFFKKRLHYKTSKTVRQ